MREMGYKIRSMIESDIAEISEIDKEAFPGESMFRPFSSYKADIHNSSVHYSVAYINDPVKLRTGEIKTGNVSWFKQLRRHRKTESSELHIIGFVGLWIMLHEAHITAIAIRKNYRRRGIGEALLISAVETSISSGAQMITLEVRVSNTIAQALYLKYGFLIVGKRIKYYSDNNEDALLMSIETINSASFQSQFRRLKESYNRN
jgi:ribosomal-protein-alanine N-acetyltransferase